MSIVLWSINVEKYHPHCKIIITSTLAELVEGKKAVNKVFEYVKD